VRYKPLQQYRTISHEAPGDKRRQRGFSRLPSFSVENSARPKPTGPSVFCSPNVSASRGNRTAVLCESRFNRRDANRPSPRAQGRERCGAAEL